MIILRLREKLTQKRSNVHKHDYAHVYIIKLMKKDVEVIFDESKELYSLFIYYYYYYY